MRLIWQMEEDLARLQQERAHYFRLLESELRAFAESRPGPEDPVQRQLIQNLQDRILSADRRLAQAEGRLANYQIRRMRDHKQDDSGFHATDILGPWGGAALEDG